MRMTPSVTCTNCVWLGGSTSIPSRDRPSNKTFHSPVSLADSGDAVVAQYAATIATAAARTRCGDGYFPFIRISSAQHCRAALKLRAKTRSRDPCNVPHWHRFARTTVGGAKTRCPSGPWERRCDSRGGRRAAETRAWIGLVPLPRLLAVTQEASLVPTPRFHLSMLRSL